MSKFTYIPRENAIHDVNKSWTFFNKLGIIKLWSKYKFYPSKKKKKTFELQPEAFFKTSPDKLTVSLLEGLILEIRIILVQEVIDNKSFNIFKICFGHCRHFFYIRTLMWTYKCIPNIYKKIKPIVFRWPVKRKVVHFFCIPVEWMHNVFIVKEFIFFSAWDSNSITVFSSFCCEQNSRSKR